ncbi:unnamed protein product [Paramecium pentaurelia]|uniref:Uncharacterized protein n=1 Tax=Paramecium pentaurelia TaxID=43138 RepID=A0A8S1X0S2_9CILI|nr:unnamed protein product [Paramecium pentaurelia]
MINQKISDAKITKFPYSSHKTQSDTNIILCHSIDQSPKTQSNKDIDTDKLSYEKMFSSNEVDLEFEDFDTKPTNSYQVVSPGLSITSYDLDQTQKSSDIQLYGSVSYNQREIPQIVLAFRKRRPAQVQISQASYFNQESWKTLSNFSSPDSSPFQNKKIQIKSFALIPLKDEEEDEIFSVFNDPYNFYGTISQTKLESMNHLQQFLTLYKMRTGTFPRQRENLENEIIISIAMNLAKIDKQLFKQYFPSKRVYFDDENDYTRTKVIKRKEQRQLTQVVTPNFQYIQN